MWNCPSLARATGPMLFILHSNQVTQLGIRVCADSALKMYFRKNSKDGRPMKTKRKISIFRTFFICMSIPILLRLDEFFKLGIFNAFCHFVHSRFATQPEHSPAYSDKAEDIDSFHDNRIYATTLKLGKNESRVLLTLCTAVKNNVHFILEWIEYMRLQGVERIVIADDESSDNLSLLSAFYQQVDPSFDLRVFPRLQNGLEYGGQARNLQHCVDTFRNLSEWILVSDTDEFLYSPSHGTLFQMLKALPALEASHGVLVDSIYAQCYRFGSSGRRRRFRYRLTREPDGTVAHRSDCGGAGGRLDLMLRQTRRGPFPDSYRADQAEEAALCARLQASLPPKIFGLFVSTECSRLSFHLCSRFAFVFDHSRFRFSSGFPVCIARGLQSNSTKLACTRSRIDPAVRHGRRRAPPAAGRRTATRASPATPARARPSSARPTSTRSARRQLAPAMLLDGSARRS